MPSVSKISHEHEILCQGLTEPKKNPHPEPPSNLPLNFMKTYGKILWSGLEKVFSVIP